MMRSAKHRGKRAAFTLVEMMVALVAGAMAITSIYFVSSSSSRHFHEQQRIAQTQMSLRVAIDQIRRDFSRAGYLGTPDSSREHACLPPAQRVQAIDLEHGVSTGVLPNAAANGVQADRVLLTGNYASGDSYLAIGMSANGNTIFLQKTWQGFQRSFGAPPHDVALFDQVFVPGRWIHLTTQDDNHFFAEIQARNGGLDPPTITIDTAWPIGSPCLQIGSGATIAPLSRIEYVVVDGAADAALSTLVSTSALAGADGPTLIRREVAFGTRAAAAPIAGTERIVAEYVANFDVDLIVNTGALGAPLAFARRDDAVADAAMDAAGAGRPFDARTAIVSLSVRSALEDERFPFPGISVPPTGYDLTAAPGAARVRTETAEILLPNLAYRDLRGP